MSHRPSYHGSRLYTSTECQPCNTNAGYTPTNDVHSSPAKTLIDLAPSEARPNLDRPILGTTLVELSRVNAICTPGVDENPGFELCPPPLTAKGVQPRPA